MEWPYSRYIQSLFESVGLDHYFGGGFNKQTFNKFFGQASRIKELENIKSKSSLVSYSNFNVVSGTQKYLVNVDGFEASRLKLLARTNCLPINSVLHRMNLRADPFCEICDSRAKETLDHVFFECTAYDDLRDDLLLGIIDLLSYENLPIDFIGLPPTNKTQFLIGDIGYFFSQDVGNRFDILAKDFLLKAVSIRDQRINS